MKNPFKKSGFFKRFGSEFKDQIRTKNPVKTKMALGFVLQTCSDGICQVLEGASYWSKLRTLRMAISDAFILNPLS